VLLVDISPEDVIFGQRADCYGCPVVRALSRMMPRGRWHFDGFYARNEAYGKYALLQHVGWDGGMSAISAYDAGAPLSVRRLVLVPCVS
jgi:hypothetical protein